MTGDGDALFRAICEQPWEDTPRLVYADWLEENGQPERAEFIRLQCEAWSLCPAYPTIEAARNRASRLARQFGNLWYSELPAPEGVDWGSLFVRGFIDRAYVVADERAEARLALVFASAPLRHLEIVTLDPSQLAPILDCPFLGRLQRIAFPYGVVFESGPERYSDEHRQLLAAAARRFPNVTFEYPTGTPW